MRRIFLHLGSSRVRFSLGLLLACLLLVEIVATFNGIPVKGAPQLTERVFDFKTSADQRVERLVKLAKNDSIGLLKQALDNYNKTYRDYTCTLTKQERLAGTLSDVQVIDIKFKERPFSVLMTWQVNPAGGDKMLYVEPADPKDRPGKMCVHPAGTLGRLLKSVELPTDDARVRQSSLRSINEFGFARGIESLLSVYEQAKAQGHLIEAICLGTSKVDGRPTVVLKRVLPAGHNYPAAVTVIDIDLEYLVPVKVRGLDWQNQLLCEYTYTNIRFNIDLKDGDFSRSANGL